MPIGRHSSTEMVRRARRARHFIPVLIALTACGGDPATNQSHGTGQLSSKMSKERHTETVDKEAIAKVDTEVAVEIRKAVEMQARKAVTHGVLGKTEGRNLDKVLKEQENNHTPQQKAEADRQVCNPTASLLQDIVRGIQAKAAGALLKMGPCSSRQKARSRVQSSRIG